MRIYFILICIVVAALIGFYKSAQNSSGSSEPLETTAACALSTPRSGRALTYGTFNPASTDSCSAFDGATTRWTGMGAAAMVGVASSIYADGATCGACLRITGSEGTVIGRITSVCAGCAEADVDLDSDSFTAITGSTSGGAFDVVVTPVPCPIATEGVRVTMNTGSHAFYLNLSPSNYRIPVASAEVDLGAGFISMSRANGDFTYTASAAVTSPAQVRFTDIFGEKIEASVDISAAGASTLTTTQFTGCP